MIPNMEARALNAVQGWQYPITGTNIAVSGTVSRNDLEGAVNAVTATQKLAGAVLAASSTYYYFLPTSGCAAVDVTLKATFTNAPTITIVPTLSDNVTAKGAATTLTALVSGTQATGSLSGLRGERGCLLKIVTAALGATFVDADYSAL